MFSTTTSARSASLRKAAWPFSDFRSRLMKRLLRCRFWKSNPSRAITSRPSPGGSTAITSAPQSARCRTQVGPARARVRSKTRSPARGRCEASVIGFIIAFPALDRTHDRSKLRGGFWGGGPIMKAHTITLTALAIALLSGAAIADPMVDMPGMGQGGMLMVGPMPSVYAGEADKPGAPVFKGLGDHHHRISTANPQTQAFFDQGVNLLFGFNHAEAIRSFREAARLDPDCAMCWWGVAEALGPNINLPMPADAVAPAWAALQKAKALEPKASAEERAWVEALAARYSADPKADRHALDEAFAKAMGELWRANPDDLDAGAFYAEAMMDTQPWDYWEQDGVTPKGHAAEIVSTLEGIIKREPNHPGALHLYIHAVEATTTPERAEAASDTLLKLMPGAGHIVHMPSHIYYRIGRYADAERVNELAARVDEDYIAACQAQGYYPAGYYGHNIHFLWTSAEMAGRYQTAIDAARRLVKAVDPYKLAAEVPSVEIYAFTPIATQLRFEKWDAVLAEPPP